MAGKEPKSQRAKEPKSQRAKESKTTVSQAQTRHINDKEGGRRRRLSKASPARVAFMSRYVLCTNGNNHLEDYNNVFVPSWETESSPTLPAPTGKLAICHHLTCFCRPVSILIRAFWPTLESKIETAHLHLPSYHNFRKRIRIVNQPTDLRPKLPREKSRCMATLPPPVSCRVQQQNEGMISPHLYCRVSCGGVPRPSCASTTIVRALTCLSMAVVPAHCLPSWGPADDLLGKRW